MNYYDKIMQPLIGGRVDDAGIYQDSEFGDIPALRIVNGDETYMVWIMQDPEGNGVGHPSVERVEFHS